MSDFAKLFGTGDDQIVILIKANDETSNPEVRLFFQPKALGVCSVAIGFKDTDKGWDLAEEAFEKMDETAARKITLKALTDLGICDEDCVGCEKEADGLLLKCDHTAP